MDKSSQIPEDRSQVAIPLVIEHQLVEAPAGLGLDNRNPFPMRAHELGEGGRLKLLSVFKILNHPRLRGIQ
jgi:hypothetical protein